MLISKKTLLWVAVGWLGTATTFGKLTPPDSGTAFTKHYPTKLPHNASSCAECHAIPSEGGSSRITVVRAGRRVLGKYIGFGLSGTLHTQDEASVNTDGWIKSLRVVLNARGDGYVEAVPEEELRGLAVLESKETHGRIHGELTSVTVPEAGVGTRAAGRFGWKSQHATVLSAAAEALRGELGVPNRLFPASLSSIQQTTQEQNDATSQDLENLVRFLRSTEPIAPDSQRSVLNAVQAGSKLFDQIGCSICHARTLRTAPAGSKLDGGTVVVSSNLGGREIHPFSDFLLHDVGTGDGVIENIRPQDYEESTANKFRTAPLWGVRFRSWLMHDGKSITYHQAIMRHSGEASEVVKRYKQLTPVEQQEVREFLDSL